MIDIFQILFSWMPESIRVVVISVIAIYILVMFISLILKIIQLIRG